MNSVPQSESCFGMGFTFFSLFNTREEYMANISICSWTKRRQSRAKRIVFRAVEGGGVCLSLSLPFHMPYAIISQDVANKIRRKQRPKCNMLVKNEPTKDPSTRRMHTQILYTHTCICMFEKCATENRRIFNIEFFSSFFRFTFVLFCFGSAPAHEGAI